MSTIIPECPVCRVKMEEGHILDATQNGLLRTTWVEGTPEKSHIFGYKIKGKRKIDTITYRCPKCGWLVWFALDPESVS